MKLAEVMKELEKKGDAQTKKTHMRHGACEPLFGVKISEMKTILKKTKSDHALALELWDTGNYDAMYLAGLMADAAKVTAKDLERWAKTAKSTVHREYSVAGVAADSPHGPALARKWIDAKDPHVQSIGWSTYSGVIATRPDEELDKAEIENLIARVEKGIHAADNRARYFMNTFVISVGGYVPSLRARAVKAARAIGVVEVDMGDTACQVPDAESYIAKVVARGGKKRKSARC